MNNRDQIELSGHRRLSNCITAELSYNCPLFVVLFFAIISTIVLVTWFIVQEMHQGLVISSDNDIILDAGETKIYREYRNYKYYSQRLRLVSDQAFWFVLKWNYLFYLILPEGEVWPFLDVLPKTAEPIWKFISHLIILKKDSRWLVFGDDQQSQSCLLQLAAKCEQFHLLFIQKSWIDFENTKFIRQISIGNCTN